MVRRVALSSLLWLAVSAGLYSQSINWGTDVSLAMNEARRTGKMVMIDVYTDWCGWCARLDETTYRDPTVVGLSSSFVSLKIDAEKNQEGIAFIAKYGVSGYPTILFVEPDGTLVNRVVGFMTADAFAARMRRGAECRDTVKTYLAEYRCGSYEHAARLISLLDELGRIDEAIPIFDRISGQPVLSATERDTYALDIASSLVDSNEYDRAMDYIKTVEAENPPSDLTWEAHYDHSLVVFYTAGKSQAMSYLDTWLQTPSVPDVWKTRYRDLKERMGKTK